ncbi:MAG TPA: DNA repair protein RadC [Candidatus Saccharimonadales bacterium]
MPRAKRIHQLPAADRPREKLHKKGARALSDFELLEVIIGKGAPGTDVGTIARHVQKLMAKGDANLQFDSLSEIKGISTATAGKVLASLELARRYLIKDAEPLLGVGDIIARLDDIRTKQQEYVVCLSLDGGQRLIAKRTITVGTLDAAIVHPRELYADAIADRAASVIIAHNHPSGDTAPSHKDIALTQQLSAAGQLIGIGLRDHIIVTKSSYFSFRQHHLL